MNTFTLSRVVDAPADAVFRAWTELDALTSWWGPKGFTMHSCTLDLRPGGMFHYCMRSPAGQEMWGRLVFREIRPSEKLVFVVSFSDKEGGITRAPMSTDWPLEVLSTVEFTEHHGKTTLAMSAEPVGASEKEIAMFTAGFEGMRGGWGGSMAQLEEYLGRGGAR
jgi:uncharacterized protein YndB with AHSA1/START domain